MSTKFIQPRKRILSPEQMSLDDQDSSFSPPSDYSPDNIDSGFERRDASEMPALDSSVGGRAVSSLLADESQPGTSIRPRRATSAGETEPSVDTAIRPRRTAPRSQQLQSEYDAEEQNYRHPQDRNGRLKSSLLNLLDNLGASAQAELASGRPSDGYSLARIAGSGLGGAARGAADPAIDERGKSKRRMLELQQQIREAVSMEQAQAENAQREANAAYTAARPELEKQRILAQSRPKGFVIAGRRIDYKPAEDGSGWQPYDATTASGEMLRDASKTPNSAGLLPKDVEASRQKELDRQNRLKIVENNNTFKEQENKKTRKARSAQFNATLREKIAARIADDKLKREGLGQGAARVKISMARAKIEAEKEGVSINEYLDALSDNNVEVTK